MESALEKFMREFASLVQMKSKSTEAVIKIIALSRINGSLQSKVRSAVKIAAASSIEQLKVLTVNAKSNGKMPTLESKFKLMTLIELPGMVQLQNSNSLDIWGYREVQESFRAATGWHSQLCSVEWLY